MPGSIDPDKIIDTTNVGCARHQQISGDIVILNVRN